MEQHEIDWLVTLCKRRNRLMRAISEWVDTNSSRMRLVTNNQAPQWKDYEQAEKLLADAVTRVGE